MLLKGVVIAAIAGSAIGFGSGWMANGWKKDLQIERIEAAHKQQQSDELREAIAERDRIDLLNEELSLDLEEARSSVRTEIQYIEREVRDVLEDDPRCTVGPAVVSLLNTSAAGGGSPRPRSPRSNVVVSVPSDTGDDEGD